jgi:hypothetical protein
VKDWLTSDPVTRQFGASSVCEISNGNTRQFSLTMFSAGPHGSQAGAAAIAIQGTC